MLDMSFLQGFDRQKVQSLKMIMQNGMRSRIMTLVYIMVLNQKPKPESDQLKRAEDLRSSGGIYCS